MKKCGSCKQILDDDAFHRCRMMADGLQIQCKDCRKEYQKQYRETAKGKQVMRQWNASSGAKQAYKRYKKSKPKVKAAHQVIKNEIRSGRMTKQPCSECGNKHAISHHDDYAFALQVRWLCPGCHNKWHKENGEGKNG